MSDCKVHIETHSIPGKTQISRAPKALNSEFIKLDERTIEDLIVATNKLSGHLNFYSKNNIILGNWSSFFGWESTAILAQIATIDVQKLTKDFKDNKRRLIISSSSEHSDLILPFFESIKNVLESLFQKITQLPADLIIKDYFNSTQPTIKVLLEAIMLQINQPDDLNIIFSNHLFNKKIQNLFGLLGDWKHRSKEQLYKNLESYSKHSPQYALYLTFLKLFENAQNDLNTFTKRHLDFYYKDILHLKPEKAKPDYVHLYVEPHDNTSPFLIEKHSMLLAGKTKEGKKKYYASTTDAVINNAKIDSVYGGFKHDDNYFFEDVTQINAQGESWNAFTTTTEADQIGFVIASPLLFLKGGTRTITIDFSKSKGGINKNLKLNTNNYNFYLTGEEAWFQISSFNYVGSQLQLYLTPEDPPIIPFNIEIHEGVSIQTSFPTLKIIAKNGRLTNFKFNKIDLGVNVSNYKLFKLFSDTGTIDHTKAFEPFGLIPKNGQSVTFSCKEFAQKKGAFGNFEISTNNGSWNIFNHTKFEYLDNGIWSEEPKWNDKNTSHFVRNRGPIHPDFTDDEALRPSNANGFYKLILDSSDYVGEAYLNRFIAESKKELEDDEVPNLPYIPSIEKISFFYSANSSDNEVSFFNMYPKGYKKIETNNWRIVPKIENDGELFIGVKDIESGNSLSLLFQVAEGSANPRQLPVDLTWSYLVGNRWETFKSESVGDETNGLTQSGIVNIQAPENLDIQTQTIFPKGIWWIKIGVEERIDAICHLVGIHAQALKASLFDHDANGLEFEENLEPEVISKLLKPKNEIKKIVQPYMSFYGRLKDTDSIFYQRSSERLRHKEKAISIWDYETLILDNFPEVYRVKCLNHYRYDAIEVNNSSAGYVTIIPVARGINVDVPVFWKPIVPIGTMNRIKAFLESKSSPHARIEVKPPKLEKLELVFNFRHHDAPGADSRLYTQQLVDVINKFLSPWAYSNTSEVQFQSEIEKSKLIQIIEMQSFVDYISEFKVNHHILDDTTGNIIQSYHDVETIIPKTVYSLFVPHKHSITSIKSICCS